MCLVVLHKQNTMKQFTRKDFMKLLGVTGAAAVLPFQGNASTPELLNLPNKNGKVRSLRMAHLTDIHVIDTAAARHGMTAALHAVNSLQDKPDFIFNGGDAIMNAVTFSKSQIKNQWNLFHEIMKGENSLPLYHCIGNHDLHGWLLPNSNNDACKKMAEEEYGLDKRYYTFERGGWQFVVLDSIHARKSVPGYFGKLDEEQLDWLKATLKSISPETPICVVSHIPILAVCTLFDGSSVSNAHWNIPDNCLHHDASMLRDLFFQYPNIKACLSGHIHLIDHVNYLGVDYYCNGAVCGSWWMGNHQQFPPAFTIQNFYTDGSTDREVHYYDWKA
jgi:predicted MPP superfamily phosphohydrolase